MFIHLTKNYLKNLLGSSESERQPAESFPGE